MTFGGTGGDDDGAAFVFGIFGDDSFVGRAFVVDFYDFFKDEFCAKIFGLLVGGGGEI